MEKLFISYKNFYIDYMDRRLKEIQQNNPSDIQLKIFVKKVLVDRLKGDFYRDYYLNLGKTFTNYGTVLINLNNLDRDKGEMQFLKDICKTISHEEIHIQLVKDNTEEIASKLREILFRFFIIPIFSSIFALNHYLV